MKRLFFVALFGSATLAYANQQIYVVHTYGDPALVPIVQDELNRGSGGTVTMYQDRLVIKATPKDYARVSALIAQIDTAPTPLVLSVATDNQSVQSDRGGSVSVGISRQIWVNGRYQNSQSTSSAQSIYTARTLSGSPVSIGTNTLVGLTQTQVLRRGHVVWVNFGTSWVSLTDGFSATAKVLPNGQVGLTLSQSSVGNTRLGTLGNQYLNSSVTVPRGQWVQVGQLRIDDSQDRSGFSFGQSSYSQVMPIWVKVD